jgi:hypothetical protein
LLLLLAAAALACADDAAPATPLPPAPPAAPPPPVTAVRLRELVLRSLPSPFYRFEYDETGRVTFVDYASGLHTYDFQYLGDRILEVQSLTVRFVPGRLSYFYNESGKISVVTYADGTDALVARISLTYKDERLVRLERERLIDGIFQLEKRMSFAYDPDGNLAELTDERLPVGIQTEVTLIDRFERYDGGINVDDFSLIHNEFFEHLVLLPGVRLQRNNPGLVTRSGTGNHFQVAYTYTYDDQHRPVTRRGDFVWLTGAEAGRRVQIEAFFSYE